MAAPLTLDNISARLSDINSRIARACKTAGRAPSEVVLVGASKAQAADKIAQFVSCGLSHCGENYLQEARDKQQTLKDLIVEWHFFGAIQSNKTTPIAQNFNWVHSIDRIKIARRLATTASEANKPLKLLIQVNIDGEASKGGVNVMQAAQLADQCSQLQSISVEGFMAIPKATDSVSSQRKGFSLLRELLISSNQQYGLAMQHLSMGMSGDFEIAIEEGSTMVRVGSSLFGERT